jgi:hypothetical protein
VYIALSIISTGQYKLYINGKVHPLTGEGACYPMLFGEKNTKKGKENVKM